MLANVGYHRRLFPHAGDSRSVKVDIAHYGPIFSSMGAAKPMVANMGHHGPILTNIGDHEPCGLPWTNIDQYR